MAKRNLTLADIRSMYTEEKRAFDRNNPWGYFVVRPISYYVTWPFLRLGISANRVTATGMIIGVIGCALLAFGSYIYMIAGVLLLNIWVLLEYVDGNVARCTKSTSSYGRFIDHLNEIIVCALLFICVGIGAFNHPDPYLDTFVNLIFSVNVDRGIFLFLGGWASLFYFLPRYIGYDFAKVFSQGQSGAKIMSRSALSGGAIGKIAFTVYSTTGVVIPILVLAVIFKFLSIFLLLWALIHTSAFVILIPKLLRKAKSSNG